MTHALHTASVVFFYAFCVAHGSYNLDTVLNFTSRLEKSLKSVEVIEKYLISLLGLGTSLKFTTLSTHLCKIRLFCGGKKIGSFSV